MSPRNEGLYLPTSGMYCVPTALEIITGEDPHTVLFPAMNRHQHSNNTLTGDVAGYRMPQARKVLEELGYIVREYKGDRLGALVRDWAARFPNHTIIASCGGNDEHHCIVMRNGKVYDSWEPKGIEASRHPFHNTRVRYAALIQKGN